MDTVLKMLLIAFISLLAFSSGVYFGKQLSDSDYQLKALESDFNNSNAAKTADNSHEANPEDSINQEEVAALSEKLINGEKSEMNKHEEASTGHEEARKVASSEQESHDPVAAHGNADPHAKPEAHAAAKAAVAAHDTHANPAPAVAHEDNSAHKPVAQQKPDLSVAAKAAQRVANNAAPVEPAHPGHENRVPTSLPKTVGSSQDVEFTVQVASYPTPEAAKEHADELVKKGFPAFPVEASVNGKVWYRVSVGSFKSQKEATMYRAQLVKQTTVPTAIVQKIRR